MGRFFLGVGLLVLFFVLGLWVAHAMDDVHQNIAQILEQASRQALAGDAAEGTALAQQAYRLWEAHWHSTAAVADHAPMDEIDSLFAQLDTYAKAGRSEDFSVFCARLSKLVAAVGEAHSLNWWNLL